MSKKNGLGKFVFGAAVGAGLGVLFAPKKGDETRKALKEKTEELISKLKEVDVDEVKAEVEKRVKELKDEIEDLDKEKVLQIAKDKSNAICKKAEELVLYAKEKGTPVLENAADSVRKEAVRVTKIVLEKLEKEA